MNWKRICTLCLISFAVVAAPTRSFADDNTLISGDVPGIIAEYVERKVGAPMLFINGAEGTALCHPRRPTRITD